MGSIAVGDGSGFVEARGRGSAAATLVHFLLSLHDSQITTICNTNGKHIEQTFLQTAFERE